VGGVVRQHGNLSFSRVFESGHDLAAYQPETAWQIFDRVMFNRDVASGLQPTDGSFNNYTTTGPSSSFQIKNVLPPSPPPLCNLYNVVGACTMDQYLALINGTADIVDFTVVKPANGGGAITFSGGL